MKKTALIILVLISTSLYAQKKSKWLVGLEYSKDHLENESLINWNGNELISATISQNNTKGMSIGYIVSERLTMNSGLYFTDRSQSMVINCYTCDVTPFNSTDLIPFSNKQYYLSIPITVSYGLLKSAKLRPNIKLGLSNNFNVKNELNTNSNFFLEGMLGASISYTMAQKIIIETGVMHRTSISSLYKKSLLIESDRSNNILTKSFDITIRYIFSK